MIASTSLGAVASAIARTGPTASPAASTSTASAASAPARAPLNLAAPSSGQPMANRPRGSTLDISA